MSESQPADASPAPEPAAPVPAQSASEPVPGAAWALPGGAQQAAGPATQPSAMAAPLLEPPVWAWGHTGDVMQAQAAPPPAPAPVKRRFTRKQVLWTGTAVVAVLALPAGAVVALHPGRSGDSVVTAVHCQPSDLVTCLIKQPAGAVQLSSTGADTWAEQAKPGARLYASDITHDAPDVSADTESFLTTDGLKDIAHTDWNAVDGGNVDLVLLAFSTQKGARAWNATRTGEILAAYPGQSIAIPGDAAGKAHAAVKADSHGDIDAAYSTVVGNIVLNVAYSSPGQLNAQDLQAWAGTELASLHTAAPAQADPPDAAAGTQQLACNRLSSCLAPMPSGSERWRGSTDSHWVSASALSTSQYIKLFWRDDPAAAQSQVSDSFSKNGVTGIAHRDWDTDNADKQADIYLIQTVSAAGAAALTDSNFGEPDWGIKGAKSISFRIPHQPAARAWYLSKKDSQGFTDFYFEATVGNVIASGYLFFYGSFDSATAGRWAESELGLVGRSAKSVPIGLSPLTAPKLPPARQGACPSSGDCLLPVPAGAHDTTSSSFQVTRSLDASPYAAQYDGASSAEIGYWLDADGLDSAEHRSWSAGGTTADAVLLKYRSPAQAQAAATLEYGVGVKAGRDCTAAALPDSYCVAAPISTTDPLQEQAVRILAWKGDYEVSVNVTRSNTADVADAYKWAQQQLDLLPAG